MESSTLPISSIHVRSNRADLLGRLADDLAHEVRNPLHAVAINIELARRRAVANAADAVLVRLGVVEEEVERVHRLVDALFVVLRSSRGDRRVEFPATLVQLRPLVEVQARMARAELVWTVDGSDAPESSAETWTAPPVAVAVAMERNAFGQALLNLVANGLDAIRPNRGRLEVSARIGADEIEMAVRDSGPGFTAEAAANFGAPGFSTRPGRAGLGLACVRALVEEAGGRLLLDDAGTNEHGTCVRFLLPRVRSA